MRRSNLTGTIGRWIGAGAALALVASILGIAGSFAADGQTPTTASPPASGGTPIPCGTLVDSWGAATADDVRVQLIHVQPGEIWGITSGSDMATPSVATPTSPVPVLTVQLEIANLGQVPVRIEPQDVILTTCAGAERSPSVDILRMASVLGSFAPGETRAGLVTFHLEPGDVPAQLTVKIQEDTRTGAYISCPLVLDTGMTSTGTISAGCSAQGGSGQAGAPGGGAVSTP